MFGVVDAVIMESVSAADRLASGHRQFYTLPNIPDLSNVDSTVYRILSSNTRSSISEGPNEVDNQKFESSEEFFDYINRSVIGYNKVFNGVFGDRRGIWWYLGLNIGYICTLFKQLEHSTFAIHIDFG